MSDMVCGDAREVLAGMDAESIHACITSPPYWGLRDYSDAVECVFGGHEGCEHEWGPRGAKSVHPQRDHNGAGGFGNTRGQEDWRNGAASSVSQGSFCSLCGAWRGQFGLEPSPEMYVEHTLEFLRVIHRVLRKDGTVWWNIGDSYGGSGGMSPDSPSSQPEAVKARGGFGSMLDGRLIKGSNYTGGGIKPKDLVMIPFRVALAAQADGWWVRSVIIWNKPNPMPESVRDRPTTSHEYVLLLTKSARYFYDADAIREPHTAAHLQKQLSPLKDRGDQRQFRKQGLHDFLNPAGRNKRTVWTIATQPYPEAHFATFPEDLVEPMILTTPTKCCAECGAGWERVVERTIPSTWEERKNGGAIGGGTQRGRRQQQADLGTGVSHDLNGPGNITLGFRPTCSCDAETKPAVVVDPFAGRGTVARGCRKHNRDYVMIEMNPDYIPMMKRYLAIGDKEVKAGGETWIQPRMEFDT